MVNLNGDEFSGIEMNIESIHIPATKKFRSKWSVEYGLIPEATRYERIAGLKSIWDECDEILLELPYSAHVNKKEESK